MEKQKNYRAIRTELSNASTRIIVLNGSDRIIS